MLKRIPIIPRMGIRPQPLQASVKLAAINKVRLAAKLPAVNSAPPAQVTLTPAAPSAGADNYLVVNGAYGATPGNVWIGLDPVYYNSLLLQFRATPKMTYLLDVAVQGNTQEWTWSVGRPPSIVQGTVTAQQGHLLIPFISTSNFVNAYLYPTTQYAMFHSAELTLVG
jgi:hypothetical protein